MDLEIFYQLVLATFLGALIGLEREIKKKEAGFQTYSLVALGACLFTVISFQLFNFFLNKPGVSFDPSRIIQAVAVGIGFIGAGVIIFRQSRVEGITTAAGLWATTAMGIAIGAKLYFLGILAALLIIAIFAGFGALEKKFLKD